MRAGMDFGPREAHAGPINLLGTAITRKVMTLKELRDMPSYAVLLFVSQF